MTAIVDKLIIAAPEHLRAFAVLNGVKAIASESVTLDDGVDLAGVSAALWVCRHSIPAGKYVFRKKHKKFDARRPYWWNCDYPAIEHDLRDCGIKPVECDIMDGLEMAREYAFSSDAIARLCGYTVAVQAALDAKGISVPFSPYDADPLFAKMRRRSMRNASQRSRRLAAGVKPHSQSLSRTRPWEAMGISRASYYRLKKSGALQPSPC